MLCGKNFLRSVAVWPTLKFVDSLVIVALKATIGDLKMHNPSSFKMFGTQDQGKDGHIVLDVIPPHYNMQRGKTSPPQSPNSTQQYNHGKFI